MSDPGSPPPSEQFVGLDEEIPNILLSSSQDRVSNVSTTSFGSIDIVAGGSSQANLEVPSTSAFSIPLSSSSTDTSIHIPLPLSDSTNPSALPITTRSGAPENEGTPSRSSWSVAGLLSSLKEKVQEPSGASAPVGKFYYDSVNVYQGLHELSSSSDDAEISPRSDGSGGDWDSPPRGNNDQVGFSSGSSQVPRVKAKSPFAANSSSPVRDHLERTSRSESVSPILMGLSQESRQDASRSHRRRNRCHHDPLIHSMSDSVLDGVDPHRISSIDDRDIGSDEEWHGNMVPLDLDDGERETFLPPSEEVSDVSRAERQARRAAKNKWYRRLWRQIRRQQTWVFLLILGVSAAVLGLAMEETMHLMILGRNKLGTMTSNYFVNYMLWVAFGMGSSLAATVLVHFVGPYSAGSGIPAVKSILSGVLMEHYLSFRTLITKVLGLVCVYAAGLFVGKEGPYVHISTALASQLARFPFFQKIRRNEGLKLQLFAAGCAAGVAVTFGAPIGGVIFSIEVTTTYYLIQNLSKGFFCAIVATLFVKLLDTQGLIKFFSTDFAPAPYTSTELVVFSLIGISFGLLGVLFNWFVRKVATLRRNYKILNSSRYGQVLFIAMISGLVTFPVLPLRMGPTSVLNDLFSTSNLSSDWSQPNIYFTLAVVVLLEFILCGVSIGLPVPCGLYTPMFILGAALGRLIGEFLHHVHLLPGIVPAGYAVVGAAAFAAGTTRTLSSSIICFELTRQLEHLLPVLLAVLIASAVGNFFGPSIYDELLKMKGLPFMPPFKSSNGSANKTAKAIMRRDVLFLTTESTFEEVRQLLIQSHYGSFPLVKSRKSRTLLGILPRTLLENALDKLESQLSALAQRQVEILNMALSSDPITMSNHSTQQQSSNAPTSGNTATSHSTSSNPQISTQDTDPSPSHSEGEAAESSETSSNTATIPTVAAAVVEPNFRSRFGGLAASLDLTDAKALPESVQIQRVMQELTQNVMNEKVGFSRKTPGLDAGAFQLPIQTPYSKVHFLFAMLGLNAAYIVDQGQLVGVVTKRDLINLT